MDVVATSVGSGQSIAVLQYDFTAHQIVAIGSGALASAAVNSSVVCLTATSNCWYRLGAAAAAHVAGSDYLPANTIWLIKIPQGTTISVIQDSAAGFLSILPARQTPL
jgi:hypothetical protein